MIDFFRRVVSLGIKMDAESLLLYEFIKIHLNSGEAIVKVEEGTRYMLLNKELLTHFFPEYKNRSWASTGSRLNSMIKDEVLNRHPKSPLMYVTLGSRSHEIEGFRQPAFSEDSTPKSYSVEQRRKWLKDEMARLGYPDRLNIKEKKECCNTFWKWWTEAPEGGKCKFDKAGGFNVELRLENWKDKGIREGRYTKTSVEIG